MMPPRSWRHAGQEAWNVHQRHQWDVENIAEADKARRLVAGVDIQCSSLHRGLIGDDARHDARNTSEAAHDVGREEALHFKVSAPINDARDHLFHVNGHPRIVGYQVIQGRVIGEAQVR